MKFKFFTTIILSFICFYNLSAQETTGSLSGAINDSSGEPIIAATLILTDNATNEQFYAYSQNSGMYRFLHVTPSNYTLEVTYIGYLDYKYENIGVFLGKTTSHDIILNDETTTLDQITVTGDKAANSGSERVISGERIGKTPTLFRSIQELNRSNPENNLNSFQGASPRFNNLNIDGVSTNDIIGFQEPASGSAGSQANGTPGGLAKTQPIGFGVIKELSVKTTPFDVSVGNFNGANIDIITKSGTNKLKKSIFGYANNRLTSGAKIDNENIAVPSFSDYQIGFNVGGALIKDKLFFFTNVEFARSKTPLINAPGTIGTNISEEDVLAVRNHLLEEFDYDPGEFINASNTIQSTKAFIRLDYIINKTHKLTFRNNFVSGFSDNLEWSASIFNFGNQGFRHNNLTNSAILELKSNFKNASNKLNVGFTRVDEGRTFEGELFPHIQIATSSASRIFAGTYREASVFNTDFSTFQLTEKFSIIKDNHSITLGGLAQLHSIDYGFLSAWNGRWEYASVDDFLDSRPSRVRGVYNLDPELNTFESVQENPSSSFNVVESAIYAQDNWDITNALSLKYGVRLDGQFLTTDLPVSPLIQQSEEFGRFTNELNNNIQVNPRFELTYKIKSANLSFHAGSGLFSGRLPYLWFAYFDFVSGTDFFNIDIRPDDQLALTENLSDLTAIQPGLAEINLLDPDFKYPRDWKSNFGVEWDPNNNWNFEFDFSFTDVIQGLLFQSINRNEVLEEFNGADNRLFFDTSGDDVRIDNNFTNVFVLTNTNKGFRYNATIRANRSTSNSYTGLGYSYGLSRDVSSTVRSSPAANFEWNQSIVGNDPDVSFSNFDLRHKVNILHSQKINVAKRSFWLTFLYNGRAGSPYTVVYQGDLNRDGSSRNDLIYVPANESEISLIDIQGADGNTITAAEQWENLDNYISNNSYLKSRRGNFAERNGGRTPWNHSLDASIKHDFIIFNEKTVSLKFDFFNVLNLINSRWGKQYFVPNVVNSSFSLLEFEGISDDNTPNFSFDIPEEQTPWVVDNITSIWRMQLGVEISF